MSTFDSKLLEFKKFELLQRMQQLEIFNFPFFLLYSSLQKEINNKGFSLDVAPLFLSNGKENYFNTKYGCFNYNEESGGTIEHLIDHKKYYILNKGIFNTLVYKQTLPGDCPNGLFYYNKSICLLIQDIVNSYFTKNIPNEWILPYIYACRESYSVHVKVPTTLDDEILYLQNDPYKSTQKPVYLMANMPNRFDYVKLDEKAEELNYLIGKILSRESVQAVPIIPIDGKYIITLTDGSQIDFVSSSLPKTILS